MAEVINKKLQGIPPWGELKNHHK